MDDEGGAAGDESQLPPDAPARPRRSRRSQTQVRFWVVLLAVLLIGNGIRLQLRDHKDTSPAVTPSASATPTPAAATTTAAAAPKTSPAGPSASTAANPRPALVTPSVSVSRDVVAVRTRAITSALARQSVAFLNRDRAAFAATLDPLAPAYRKARLAAFDNTAEVPFGSWSYEVEPADVAAATTAGSGRVTLMVTLHYALRGFDSKPTELPAVLTFTPRSGGWLVAGDGASVGGTRTARDIWDFGPVSVVRGAHSLVLAHPGNAAAAHTLAVTADAAVPRVTAFWGNGWARSVVVLLPGTQAELRSIVGTTRDLSQIAALATAEIGGSSGAVGNRVVINPATFSTLGALGRRVVMTHEITHVATRSVTTASTPTWLVEGIADYVGFKGTTTSVRFDAAELGRKVDSGWLPSALPTAEDFADAGTLLPLQYEQSWLACSFIVSRTSEASLIAFYRAVGTSKATPAAAVKAAFATVLHTNQATFTRSWRSYVAASLK